MTKLSGLVIIGMFFILQNNSFAESSKMIKVDLDVKTTQIVRADIDQDGWQYYIDTNACLCWIGQVNGGSTSASTFDCSLLKAHPKLTQYVEKCHKQETSAAAATQPTTPAQIPPAMPAATEPAKTEEKK